MDVMQQNVMRRQARLDPIPYDPATGEAVPRATIKIVVRTNGFTDHGGETPLDRGEHTISVYETDLARLRKVVESATATDLEFVQRDLDWHREQCAAGDNPRHYEPDFGGSFLEVMKRPPAPLASLEIIKQGSPNKGK